MSTNIYGYPFYERISTVDRLEKEYRDKVNVLLSRPTAKLDMSPDLLNARLIELESRMNNLYTKLDETNKMNEYLQEMINEKL